MHGLELRLVAVIAALIPLGCGAGAGSRGAADAADPASDADPVAVDAADAPLELSLMSFNIRYENENDGDNVWPNRQAMVLEVITSEAADVVGLQEAERGQLDDLGPPAPYLEIGVGRSDGATGGEYSPILYRGDRFDLDEHGTFWLSSTPEVPGSFDWGNTIPRICTWARLVDRESGQGFYVYNTHLDHQSQPARARGVELIAARIAARAHLDPVFVTGDFNAGEQNPVVRYLDGAADRASAGVEPVAMSPGLDDSFRVVHPDATEVGTFNAWIGTTTGEKIDYIFASPGPAVEVVDAEILRTNEDGRYPSDHFPVTARVKIH